MRDRIAATQVDDTIDMRPPRQRIRNGTGERFDLEAAVATMDGADVEDVFSKIAMCRKHYQECRLGARHVERFIR